MNQSQKLTNQQIKVIEEIYGKYNQLIFENGNLTIVIANITQELTKSKQKLDENVKKFKIISNEQKRFIQTLKSKYGQSMRLNTQDWTIQKQ